MEAEKIKRSAVIAARARGFGKFSEDLSQDVFVALMKNPKRKARIDLLVLDSIRGLFGDPRSETFEVRQAISNGVPFDDESVEHCRNPEDSIHKRLELELALSKFKWEERAVLVLSVIWGCTQAELAVIFGVDESMIHKKIKEISEKLGLKRRRRNVGRA